MKRTDILLVGEVVLWVGLQLLKASASRACIDSTSVNEAADQFRKRFESHDRNPDAA